MDFPDFVIIHFLTLGDSMDADTHRSSPRYIRDCQLRCNDCYCLKDPSSNRSAWSNLANPRIEPQLVSIKQD